MSRRTIVGERVVYTLSIDLPPGLTCTSMAKYIDNALVEFRKTDSAPDVDGPLKFSINLLERHVRYSR